MRQRAAQRAFWGSLSLLVYLYLAFPVLVILRGALRGRPVRRGRSQPTVSLIIAAHNEEALIVQKLLNALELDYPPKQLEIIVASDGSDDQTNELVSGFASRGVRLLALPRQGKNATLNAAAATSSGQILVFNDADMAIAPDSLSTLVAAFEDPDVGGIAGERRHRGHASRSPLARMLGHASQTFQKLLSQGGSVTIAGLLYAIRREHFRPVPANVVDDFFIPAQVILDKRRLVFDHRATTYPLGPPQRVRAPFLRTLRMNVQYLRSYVHLAGLFNPFGSGFYSIQILSHKVLRRFLIIPLTALLMSGLVLWRTASVYRIVTLMQLALHGMALAGLSVQSLGIKRVPLLRRVMTFDRELVAAGVALGAVFFDSASDRWDSHRVEDPPGT